MRNRRWITRAIASGLVIAVGAVVAIAAAGVQLVVEPPVITLQLSLGMGGSAASTLRNIGDAGTTVGSIVADASCAPGVSPNANPTWPFTIGPGGTHTVGMSCTSAATYGIRRCKENVLGTGGQILTSYTALCIAEGPTTWTYTGSHDFNDVMVGGTSAIAPLTILNGATNPMHSLVSIQLADNEGNFTIHAPCLMDGPGCDAAIVVAPAQMFIVNVSCSPKSVGLKTAQLYIVGNGGTKLSPPIALSCNGTTGSSGPSISANPANVTLSADVGAGMASSSVLVSNIGTGPLTISSITKAGSPDWIYTPVGGCQTQPCTVAGGSNFTIETQFAPTAIGARDATITIASDDPITPMLQIPLNGTGLGATIALASSLGMPATLDLGTTPIGIQTTATFDLRNDGNVTLTPVNLALVQAGSELTVSPNPTTINAASTRTITVGCTPTAAQLFTGQLDITAPNARTGSPISIAVKCTGSAGSLYATPSSIQLGEVRTGSPRVQKTIALKTAGGSLTLSAGPMLSPAVDDLSLTPPSSSMVTLAMPSMFDLLVDATTDHDLATTIAVSAGADTLSIPVTGKVVTAKIAYPDAIMVGSFCVNQPTTSAPARLTATGTATIGLATQPVLDKMSSSPFQLGYTAPVSYPYSLPASQSATVDVTPLRQMTAGPQVDEIVWATDVESEPAPRTKVTAEFISDGGAIAPQVVDFGEVLLRQFGDPRVIRIQNCGMEPVALSAVEISPGGEFSDDSPIPLPEMLAPKAIATISVMFRPTKVGLRRATLTVGSSKGLLAVSLNGQGKGTPETTPDPTSFYACDFGLVVAAAGVALSAPGTTNFHPVPAVLVIHSTAPGGTLGTIVLQNDGTTDVTVGSITRAASCDPEVTATVAQGPPFDVLATSGKPMTIHCSGTPLTGMKRCLFHINDGAGDPYFDAEGVCEYGQMPSLGPGSGTLDFGNVAVGGTGTISTTVHNNSPTTITQLFFQTTDLGDNFKIGMPCNPDARECDAFISGVSMGSDASFVVKCTPQSAGPHTATLSVASNTSQYVAPPIQLVCNGVTASGPVLSLTGSPIDVGPIEVISGVGSGAVHLRNAGDGTLRIKSVQITGATGADWTYLASGQCSGALPPLCDLAAGQVLDIGVTFDPSAIGTRDASLLVQYFDTADRSTTVPLRGVGLGATLSLVGGATAIDFGVVPLNITSQVTFQLANDGNRALSTVALGGAPSGPFTLTPSAMTSIGANSTTTITAACRPTSVGTFTTTFTASAPDAFMSPPISIAATCRGTTMAVYANPTTIALGEVRTQTAPAPTPLMILGTSPVQVTGVELETPSDQLSVTASLGTTPVTAQLTVAPTQDSDLANAILVTSSAGMLRIPITGRVVTADFSVPPVTSLGTFCVNASTPASTLALTSTGTATLRLAAPRMDSASSAFDLTLSSPAAYPAMLAPGGKATIAITPKRQAFPGGQHDEIVWSTDVANRTEERTMVSALFVADGGAIAPSSLAFGKVPIHIDTRMPQSVTLQNCDTTPIMIDDPEVLVPFTIDSPNFPRLLAPNETATFSVGFHPSVVGTYVQTLTVRSMQLDRPLEVMLTGEGVNDGGDGDGGLGNGLDPKSFYGCSGCSTHAPGGGLVIGLACAAALRRRRRRGC